MGHGQRISCFCTYGVNMSSESQTDNKKSFISFDQIEQALEERQTPDRRQSKDPLPEGQEERRKKDRRQA